jgi:hypothetical protein
LNEGHERLYLSLHTRMTMIGHVKRGDPLIGRKIMLFLLNIAWFILLANASAKEAFTVLPIRSPNKTKKVTAVDRNAEYVPITKNITIAFTGWSTIAIAGWFSRKNHIIFCGILFLMLAFTT